VNGFKTPLCAFKNYGVDLSGPVKIRWNEVSRLIYLPYGRYFRADQVVERE